MVAERKDISRPTGVRPSRNGKRAPVQIDRRFAISQRSRWLRHEPRTYLDLVHGMLGKRRAYRNTSEGMGNSFPLDS